MSLSTDITRRGVLAGSGAALLGSVAARAQELLPSNGPRVLVVGGGWGGTSTAKYIRLLDPRIEVVLLEREPVFHSCPVSNWVIGHIRTVDDITHSYDTLKERYGIKVIQTEVLAVDPGSKTLCTADGTLSWDRLVLSPGIELDHSGIEGWSEEAQARFPSAWIPGEETARLRGMLAEMPVGGTVAISVPLSPYRCPPGPYERISLIASYLKREKPGSRIVVLDANSGIVSKGKLFQAAWDDFYDGIIDYRPESQLAQVDASAGILSSDFDDVQADVGNVIPPQRAPRLLREAGLVPEGSNWAPVDPFDFSSSLAPEVHIIGDATDQLTVGKLPKSGFVANSMGKVTAWAIVAQLSGREPPMPSLINTCYSLVSPEEGISVGAVYGYDKETGKLVSKEGSTGTSSARSKAIAANAWDWAQAIWSDMLT